MLKKMTVLLITGLFILSGVLGTLLAFSGFENKSLKAQLTAAETRLDSYKTAYDAANKALVTANDTLQKYKHDLQRQLQEAKEAQLRAELEAKKHEKQSVVYLTKSPSNPNDLCKSSDELINEAIIGGSTK